MGRGIPRFPECIDCPQRSACHALCDDLDLVASMMLYLHHFNADLHGLIKTFNDNHSLDRATIKHIYNGIQSYIGACPICQHGHSNKSKVLLMMADPDRAELATLSARLCAEGYEVLPADNHSDALALFKAHQDDVRIIIADFYMDGGIGLLKKIETLKPHQPILVLSDSEYCSVEAGCHACKTMHHRKRMKKPYSYERLVDALLDYESYTCESYMQCTPLLSEPFEYARS